MSNKLEDILKEWENTPRSFDPKVKTDIDFIRQAYEDGLAQGRVEGQAQGFKEAPSIMTQVVRQQVIGEVVEMISDNMALFIKNNDGTIDIKMTGAELKSKIIKLQE